MAFIILMVLEVIIITVTIELERQFALNNLPQRHLGHFQLPFTHYLPVDPLKKPMLLYL